ncbi:MAG: hypothetical protein MJA29_13395 [Candidatus Omnitrophica bacterium]|nr:hypothetical protein [Candidatus Omnitrophota bacterium]
MIVDKAIIVFISLILTTLNTDHIKDIQFKLIKLNEHNNMINNIIIYINKPIITNVEECNNAETGIGAFIAPNNQLINGN